jgi:hypothetical protein
MRPMYGWDSGTPDIGEALPTSGNKDREILYCESDLMVGGCTYVEIPPWKLGRVTEYAVVKATTTSSRLSLSRTSKASMLGKNGWGPE